ncbi:MAG: ATP-binding cassette domain-containing protein [Planctomycetota bacterium]
MLSVDGICKEMGVFALRDVSFEVQGGEYFILLGASGVGKSVLLEMIAGLAAPDSGRIRLDGKDITEEKIRNRGTALVFQEGALFPHMTVWDNIAYPLRCRGLSRSRIRARVGELAEDFAVAGLLEASPRTLSGGETQRVSLARAVASEPRCLLLDEPISSLDAKARSEMRALLRRINSEGRMIVHVTHDYAEAASLGKRIAVMEGGTVAQVGTVEEVFQRPRSEFVARFVGIRNFYRGQLQDGHEDGTKTRQFDTGGLVFSVVTDSTGGEGSVCVRSEDVTISTEASRTSARNRFEGAIVDMAPAGGGVEVIVDIGVEVAALITAESAEMLELRQGKKVWVSFKASAVNYVEA